jgi:hypothetical protein
MRLLLAALLAGFGCGEPDVLTQAPVPARDLCEEESIEIDPSGLAFGRLIPGTSRVRSAMLTYKGCEPTTLAIETDGLFDVSCDRGAFCFEEPVGLEVMPGESVPISVKFQPSNVGLALGGFIVSGCPTRRCRAELLLQGSAQLAGVVCHPDPLDFGVVTAGECASRRIDCTNVVDRPVRIERVAPLEETSSDLDINSAAPIDVPSDGVFGIDINYCPIDDGSDQGTLIVVSSVEGRTSSVAAGLSGRSGGGRLDVPAEIDFGMVSLIAPARRPMRVTNGGAYRLEVYGVDTEPPFSTVLASGASLGAGESAHLWVQIEATTEGPIEGAVLVYSDDPEAPVRAIRATALGVNLPPCEMTAPDEEIDFGQVPVGEVGTRDLTLTNEGALDCYVTAASVVEVASAFEVPEARSMQIAPGSSASISVKFTPTSTNAASAATLEIGVSSPEQPYRRVPLIGRGQ